MVKKRKAKKVISLEAHKAKKGIKRVRRAKVEESSIFSTLGAVLGCVLVGVGAFYAVEAAGEAIQGKGGRKRK